MARPCHLACGVLMHILRILLTPLFTPCAQKQRETNTFLFRYRLVVHSAGESKGSTGAMGTHTFIPLQGYPGLRYGQQSDGVQAVT